ncbi:MAG: hypothetical protein Q8930_05935, partial [Bacillota bacterium]|nr:hypothetical protein [Bacillota bacterium]
MVSLIDRNFNRYRGTLEQRVQEAEQDIRRDLHWIFDIFRTLGVSPATSGRLTDTVVRASIRNLRPAAATPPAPPSVPSPTVPHTPPTSMPRY